MVTDEPGAPRRAEEHRDQPVGGRSSSTVSPASSPSSSVSRLAVLLTQLAYVVTESSVRSPARVVVRRDEGLAGSALQPAAEQRGKRSRVLRRHGTVVAEPDARPDGRMPAMTTT